MSDSQSNWRGTWELQENGQAANPARFKGEVVRGRVGVTPGSQGGQWSHLHLARDPQEINPAM